MSLRQRTDEWLTVAKLVVYFLAHAFLIDCIGWPIAATLLFFGGRSEHARSGAPLSPVLRWGS